MTWMSGYAGGLYDFAWSDYCDWFLEMARLERGADASDGERSRVWWCAARTLAATLSLLHPIVPFVTEGIWSRLHALDPRLTDGEPLLISARWPQAGTADAALDARVADLIELVRGIRNLRTAAGVPPASGSRWRSPWPTAAAGGLGLAVRFLEPMARARPIALRPGQTAPRRAGHEQRPAWPGSSARRRAVAAQSRAFLRQGIDRLEALLADVRFVERAPPAVVQRERDRCGRSADPGGPDRSRLTPSGYRGMRPRRC